MTTGIQCFQFDTVEVRPGTFEVLRDGAALPLEPKSIRVLIYLLEHRDRAVSKDELLGAVWQDTAVTDNALTRVIAQLRRELGDDARNPRYIQTIPTLGYRFVAEVGATASEVPIPEPATARKTKWWPLVAALSLLVAGGVLWTAASRAREPEVVRQSSARQMTSSAGLDFGSSFSPDGRRFTYSSDKSGRFEVYIRDLESSAGERQLTTDGAQNIQPVWSPDGRQIAWHSVTRRGIWLAPADGSGPPRQVVRWGSQPAWSPDSQRIAYRSDDVHSLSVYDLISAAKTSIQVVRADGVGAPVTIASTGPAPGRQAFPTWSPDGKKVLFSAARGNGGELWTVDPDGKSPKLLLRRERNVFISPVYSPSGDSLYFGAISKTRDLGIWRQKLTRQGAVDGEPVELAHTGNVIPMYLSVSRDGKRLAYSATMSTSHLWSLPMAGEAAGGEPTGLYQDTVYRASFPSFSPDGRKIAFFARLFGGNGDIWTMNADGSGPAQLTTNGCQDVLPEWAQDGGGVLYGRLTDSGVQLWEKKVADGAERSLTGASKPVPGWPRMSPDGRKVAYHSLSYHAPDDKVLNISVASLPNLSDMKQLTRDAEGAGFPAWSPDGKWIAYELFRGPHSYLSVMDADGNGQEQLNTEPGHAWLFGWSPDGRKILFAGFREGAWNLWWIDRETRQQKQLTDYRSLRTFVRYPAWSPARDQIVYELGTTRGNVFRLDLGDQR